MVRIVKEHEERRLELIETAARLFLEKGFGQTTVKDIVETAKVAQGTFYYYFASKDEVLAAVGMHLMRHLLEDIKAISEADITPADKINNIVDLIFSSHEGGHSMQVHMDEEHHTLLHDRMVRAGQQELRSLFSEIIKAGNEHGQFDVAFPAETAEFLIFGLAELEHRSSSFQDQRSAQTAGAALEEILSRILAVKNYIFKIKVA